MPLLFAYGTLLRGESNHHYLKSAKFLGAAATTARFTLYDFGDYPAIVEGGAHPIAGELYEVDEATLARVDELEEVPGYYERREVMLEDGRRAITYVLPPRLAEKDGGKPLAHGDWRKR